MESMEEQQNEVLMALIVEKGQTVLLPIFSVDGQETVVKGSLEGEQVEMRFVDVGQAVLVMGLFTDEAVCSLLLIFWDEELDDLGLLLSGFEDSFLLESLLFLLF